MRTGGIVLCGGESSRMGRPKAWLPFGAEFMLQRVVRVLREVVEPVVVVAAPNQDVPPLPPGVMIARDEVGGNGPLGGLAAGLAALAGRCDAVYLSSCDVPLLRAAFVRRVIEGLEEPLPPTPSPKKGGGAGFSPSPFRGGVVEGLPSEPLPPTPSPKKGGGEKQAPQTRYVVRGQRVAEEKARRAKELRREMTPAECLLWELVRANRLGYHIRRQQVIEGYIADFYCHAAALVIEVDGAIHDDHIEYDARRTTAFAVHGIRVIRFRNDEVLGNLEAVREHILAVCAERLAGRSEEPLPPTPSPKKGGGDRADSLALAAEEGAAPAAPLAPPPFLGEGVGGRGSSLCAVPCVNGFLHPLAAAYRVEVLPVVRAMLAANRLRMTDLFDLVTTRTIGAEELIDADPELASLRNLNTPEEYEAALRELDTPFA